MHLDDGRDDDVLVRASQQGDRDAFGILVERHARSILAVTTRMLGSPADAEDVAQDVFAAAYTGLARFQCDAKFSTWLYRIAINKCRDVLRARRPGIVSFDPDVDEGAALAWERAVGDTPESTLAQTELAGELEQAIQALPPHYRESFILRHVEGLDYEEMSAIVGVHRDTLKMRVYKARTRLADALAHLEVARP